MSAARTRDGDTRSLSRATIQVNGKQVNLAIVSDQSEIRTGDCVVVEESGSTANRPRIAGDVPAPIGAGRCADFAANADACIGMRHRESNKLSRRRRRARRRWQTAR